MSAQRGSCRLYGAFGDGTFDKIYSGLVYQTFGPQVYTYLTGYFTCKNITQVSAQRGSCRLHGALGDGTFVLVSSDPRSQTFPPRVHPPDMTFLGVWDVSWGSLMPLVVVEPFLCAVNA